MKLTVRIQARSTLCSLSKAHTPLWPISAAPHNSTDSAPHSASSPRAAAPPPASSYLRLECDYTSGPRTASTASPAPPLQTVSPHDSRLHTPPSSRPQGASTAPVPAPGPQPRHPSACSRTTTAFATNTDATTSKTSRKAVGINSIMPQIEFLQGRTSVENT